MPSEATVYLGILTLLLSSLGPGEIRASPAQCALATRMLQSTASAVRSTNANLFSHIAYRAHSQGMQCEVPRTDADIRGFGYGTAPAAVKTTRRLSSGQLWWVLKTHARKRHSDALTHGTPPTRRGSVPLTVSPLFSLGCNVKLFLIFLIKPRTTFLARIAFLQFEMSRSNAAPPRALRRLTKLFLTEVQATGKGNARKVSATGHRLQSVTNRLSGRSIEQEKLTCRCD